MRIIKRLPLPSETRRTLAAKQSEIDGKSANAGFDANREWNNYRKSKPIVTVRDTLKKMAGKRERCMYCEDSHGTDIEHFRPKTKYPGRMFVWENHLLCCTDCGRIKGEQCPLDNSGSPLLIDPTVENPWDFLEFDPDTGNLVARYDNQAEAFSPKGTGTVEALKLDRREALAEGYRRSLRRIKSVLEPYLTVPTESINSKKLSKDLKTADEHGLLEWCFQFAGRQDSPFLEFIQRHSSLAARLIRHT